MLSFSYRHEPVQRTNFKDKPDLLSDAEVKDMIDYFLTNWCHTLYASVYFNGLFALLVRNEIIIKIL
jgi:hypothetical protein